MEVLSGGVILNVRSGGVIFRVFPGGSSSLFDGGRPSGSHYLPRQGPTLFSSPRLPSHKDKYKDKYKDKDNTKDTYGGGPIIWVPLFTQTAGPTPFPHQDHTRGL